MKVVPIPHELDALVGQSHAPRSSGLHVSDIYNDMYQELEPKRYKRDEPPNVLRMEAGLALEDILEVGLKRRMIRRPGEFFSSEGIAFTPDILMVNGALTRVGEIKLTWMSSRNVPREPVNGFPPKFGKYLCQMMAYGHCLGTPYARLIVFFVNGDYKFYKQPDGASRPCGPELLAWDIEFSPRELEENWNALMSHARHKNML